jgi:regulator of cell morphogenesis and NO signaling
MEFPLLTKPDSKASDIIERNPLLLLLFEHLNIPLGFHEKTVEQLCADYKIELKLFLVIANLFNGFNPNASEVDSLKDIRLLIAYLENSHKHYTFEKFPLLTSYIEEITNVNSHPEIELLKRFFDDYLEEVAEHLRYENNIVFPYVLKLAYQEKLETDSSGNKFSMADYRSHHDDIEEKLTDLKNLLIRYLPPDKDMQIRRRLILTLNELEFDLHIHSLIEESILIPIVEKLEQINKG